MPTPITAHHTAAGTWLIPATPEGQDLLDAVHAAAPPTRPLWHDLLALVVPLVAALAWVVLVPPLTAASATPHPDSAGLAISRVFGAVLTAAAGLLLAPSILRAQDRARAGRARVRLEESGLAVEAPPVLWGQTLEREHHYRQTLQLAVAHGRERPEDPFSPERIDSALASLPDVDGVPALSVLWHAGQQGTAEDVAHALLERRAALETERAQQSAAARAAREQGQQTARAQALHDARDAATRSH